MNHFGNITTPIIHDLIIHEKILDILHHTINFPLPPQPNPGKLSLNNWSHDYRKTGENYANQLNLSHLLSHWDICKT